MDDALGLQWPLAALGGICCPVDSAEGFLFIGAGFVSVEVVTGSIVGGLESLAGVVLEAAGAVFSLAAVEGLLNTMFS